MQHCQRVGSPSAIRNICETAQPQPTFVTTGDYYVPDYIDNPLDPNVDTWLSDFAHRPVSEIDFTALNSLIATGSANIGSSPTDALSRGEYIKNAREAFFWSPLGLDLANTANPMHSTVNGYNATRHWPPIMTFIRSQRFQYANKMNGAHNVKTAKSVIGISAEYAAQSFAALRQEGCDPVEIAHKSGGLLELSGENLHMTVGLLRQKGLDATHVLSQNPSVLGRNTTELGKRIDVSTRIAKLLNITTPPEVLISESPQWLSVGDAKVRVIARVLSTHTQPGAIPEIPARIKKIAQLPVESVLSSIIEEGTFTTAAAERESLRRPITNRKTKLQEQLQHRANLDLLGQKTVTAYIAYAEKIPMQSATKAAQELFASAIVT